MTISKKTIDLLNLDQEVKAELLKELIEADYDSYILTPKAMLILNDLNEQAVDDACNGHVTFNIGKFGELNHNGRIYMNGEHITGGQVAKQIQAELRAELDHPKSLPQIIDENMQFVSTKIVEDEVHFEKVAYDGRSLEGLTMKDEYKFESFQRAIEQNQDKVIIIDSIPTATGEIKGVQLSNQDRPVKILVTGPKSINGGLSWKEILDMTKGIPLEDLHAGVPHHQVTGKVRYATGMALHTGGCFSDMEGYGVSYRGFPEKEVAPTVSTNGRQKLVDNGKRQWPGAKQRKGHRKHG